MNKWTEKLMLLWDRLKKIKHIGLYLALLLAVIVVGIYFTTLSSSKEENPSTNLDTNIQTFSSSSEYITWLENKLENVLGKVKGAGNVEIILTLDKGFEYVYVTEEEIKELASGGSVTTTKVVLVNGQPVLEEEIFPSIKGIVVVSQGAEDVGVRLNLLSALQTVVSVDSSKITILEGN